MHAEAHSTFAAEARNGEGHAVDQDIAKTLLERSGAELSFANGSDYFEPRSTHSERSGAFVEVIWTRDRLEIRGEDRRRALGQNVPIKL